MSSNLFDLLLLEVRRLFDPVVCALENPRSMELLLASLGVTAEEDGAGPLRDTLSTVRSVVTRIEELGSASSPSLNQVAALLELSDDAFAALRALSASVGRTTKLGDLGRDLMDILLGSYLRDLHPLARSLLALLTLLEPADELGPRPPVVKDGRLLRAPLSVDRFRFDRLADLLRNPAAALLAEYGNALQSVEDGNAAAQKLFLRLLRVLRTLKVPARYGIAPEDAGALGSAAPLLDHALIVYVDDPLAGVPAEAGVVLHLSPSDRGDLGLILCPFGALTFSRSAGLWTVDTLLTAGVDVIAYGRHGLTLLGGDAASEVSGSISASLKAPDDGPAFVLGAPEGTRLEVGGVRLRLAATLSEARQSLEVSADVASAALVLARGEGDGFLNSILPPGETRADFDLGLIWSSEKGLTLRGSGTLDATFPVALSVGGVTLSAVHLSLKPDDVAVVAELTASLSATLGPVNVAVDRVGLLGKVVFPEGGGNLGVVNLDLGFKPPNGVGLAINSSSVTGGGFLFFDPQKEQYAGIVQLDINGKLALKAVGLLTTRMSDGSRGFSLLLIISGEFKPINIGFGFTLNGVGGLIGINRTVSIDVLRSGLKNGTLDSVLFPPDPIRNAPQILSNLRAVFPPTPGQHIFGPMAKIGWGTPTMLTIDLAIAMEFPSPTRLIVLGQFRALLPSKDQALVKLQMDALGVVDFDKGEASLDATLYDSRILQYTMSGDMALRARWEEDPTFLLAVGGFNPRFPAPAGFPTLKRVDINLTKGKNPRIRLEAYLALTSNTVQLGARADLFLGFSSFSVEGYLSFDALFQFSPFRFITDFSGGVTLKWRSYNLAGIHLKATLEGPSPWHIHGEAKFSVWIFDKTVTVDKTIGEEVKPELPPPVDPVPLLRQALNDKRNWISGLPAGGSMLVTLRQLPPSEEVIVHPLGELAVTQRVVPLNLDIAKFGNTKPKGAKRFTLDEVQFDGQAATDIGFTSEHFAPAEFLEMSDEEKLSRPSFEKLDAGIRIGTSEITFGEAVGQKMKHETIVIDDKDAKSEVVEGTELSAQTFAVLARFGASRRSVLRKTGRAKFLASESARGVTVRGEAFVVASTDDLTVNANQPVSAAAGPRTLTEAQAALKTLIERNPAERGRWQVVRRHVVRN